MMSIMRTKPSFDPLNRCDHEGYRPKYFRRARPCATTWIGRSNQHCKSEMRPRSCREVENNWKVGSLPLFGIRKPKLERQIISGRLGHAGIESHRKPVWDSHARIVVAGHAICHSDFGLGGNSAKVQIINLDEPCVVGSESHLRRYTCRENDRCWDIVAETA